MTDKEQGLGQGAPRKARVLIVDDHPLVREGLSRRINREADMEVCGEVETAHDALSAIASNSPDVAVIDLVLKASSGLELIKDIRIRRPDLATLVLSAQDETIYAERALRAGARGYIMKHEASENVLVALRRVLSGKVYLSDAMASKMLDGFVTAKDRPPLSPVERLTDRELQVFEFIGQGLTTRQIAERLHLSMKTIDAYRQSIKMGLGLGNAAELAQRAVLWVQAKTRDSGPL